MPPNLRQLFDAMWVRGSFVDEKITSQKRRATEMKKEDKWQESFRSTSEEVSCWRKKHPKATFSEIENNVDGELAKIRADMIQDLLKESELQDFKTLPQEKRPKCPVCGKTLASNGRQSRELVTSHEQVIEVERSKGYCKRCRVSYFPPR